MSRERIAGLIELCRPVNAIGATILVFVGAYVAGNTATLSSATGGAALATGLAVGAGNAINDYFDREIDAINQPERPLPRGAVAPTTALVWASLLFVVAVTITLTLPLAAIIIAGLNLFLLVTYTSVFKGIPAAGNAVVAYLVGSAVLFGGAAVSEPAAVLELAVLAGLATFAREIIKDIEDLDGDQAEGLRTLPAVVGEKRAATVGVVSLLGAVLISPLPFLTGTFGLSYLAFVLVADIIAVTAAWYAYRNPTRSQRLTKVAMFVAVVAFGLGQAMSY